MEGKHRTIQEIIEKAKILSEKSSTVSRPALHTKGKHRRRRKYECTQSQRRESRYRIERH